MVVFSQNKILCDSVRHFTCIMRTLLTKAECLVNLVQSVFIAASGLFPGHAQPQLALSEHLGWTLQIRSRVTSSAQI
jgi:hypothetical protein